MESADYKRAAVVIDDLLSQLETHAEDLVIADTSPHGWLAVAKVRAGTDLPKSLRKKLEQVDRELSAQKNRNGGPGKKFFGLQKEGQGPLLRRDGRRISPEEALSYASKQVRAGICTHCKKAYHYYRECPTFWQQVQESREEAAKVHQLSCQLHLHVVSPAPGLACRRGGPVRTSWGPGGNINSPPGTWW